MRYIYLLFLGAVCLACSNTSEDSSRTLKYYDVSTQIQKLIDVQIQQNPTVSKEWILNQEKEQKEVKDLDWEKELKPFRNIDLNKSAYITSYDSVLTENTLTYSLKPEEELPIKMVKITFDAKGQMQTLYALTSNQNYLFTNQMEVTLTQQDGSLQEYDIQSSQKLLWFKADSSYVKGRLF